MNLLKEKDINLNEYETLIKAYQSMNKDLNSLLGKKENLIKELREANNKKNQIIDFQKKIIDVLIKKSLKEKNMLSFLQDTFIPQIIPSNVAKLLNLSSSFKVNKLANDFGLFKYKMMAIRISRIKKKEQVKKYQTTVLFSILGIFILKILIEIDERINKKIENMEVISKEEQKEIKDMNIKWDEKKKYSHEDVFN